MVKMNKKGQEEMVGFALIVMIVAIVLLFLVGFYIRGNEGGSSESYEAESFIQAALSYTTTCEDFAGNFSVQEMISECLEENVCQNGKSSCEVLEESLLDISNSSWAFGEDRPVSGYNLQVSVEGSEILNIEEGLQAGNFRNALQSVSSKGNSIEIYFRVYYK